jgi:hypothetical protein
VSYGPENKVNLQVLMVGDPQIMVLRFLQYVVQCKYPEDHLRNARFLNYFLDLTSDCLSVICSKSLRTQVIEPHDLSYPCTGWLAPLYSVWWFGKVFSSNMLNKMKSKPWHYVSHHTTVSTGWKTYSGCAKIFWQKTLTCNGVLQNAFVVCYLTRKSRISSMSQ